MSSIGRHRLEIVFVACLLSVSLVAAEDQPAASRLRLAEWVDDDVGLCLEVDELGNEWTRFRESRLYQGLAGFPPVAGWFSQHRQELSLLSGEIERRTGVAARDVATKLLGRQALFAIWPPVNPATDKPAVLLLAESTDGELLRGALERLVEARRQAGRWRGQHTLQIAEEKFSVEVVVPAEEQSEFFITSVGDVALFASDERLLREVLQRRSGVSEPGSLAASPVYLAAAGRLAEGDSLRLFINPRAWDAALEADLKAKTPGSEEAKSQAVIVAAWRAMDYVTGGVELTPRLAVELAWAWRAEALPEPVREVAGCLAGRSQFVDHLPDDALIAFAGHMDIKRLVRYWIEHKIGEPARKDPREQLDRILFWALAAGLGPDWGGFLRVATAEGAQVEIVAGLQTLPLEADSGRPPLAENLEPVLHALLSSAVESVNRQSGTNAASLRSAEHEGCKITSVFGMIPDRPRQELAYCVDRLGRLWFGTSAAAVELALLSKRVDGIPPQDSRGPSSVVSVNLAEWRKLASGGQHALEFLWEGKQLDSREKDRQYKSLLAFSQVADRLVLATRIDESTVHLSCVLDADTR
jgi:hypothetical protein